MIVSLEAIFLSTFVMISQNRQDDAVRPAGRLGGAGHGAGALKGDPDSRADHGWP